MRLPVFYISHGGGPWIFLDGEFRQAHGGLETYLKALPRALPRAPRAILMISAHWEEDDFTVMTSAQPPMLYDYGGFPPNTYQVKYSAPGSPELAHEVQNLLEKSGLKSSKDRERGFDHGAFVPLAAMYPQEEIPVVQLSIRNDYDPAIHFAAGRALASLRDEGVLILASGSSYHNLRNFGPRAKDSSHAFDEWLTQAVVKSDSQTREKLLQNWASAPAARLAHPQEDHLVPLFVAVGAAEEEKAVLDFHADSFLGGIALSGYRFG